MLRRSSALLAFAIVAVCLCAGGQAARSARTAQNSGPLRIVTTFANSTFPNPATDYIEPQFGDSEYLLKPTSKGPVPWLAKSYKQVNNLTWSVTLRPGLKFQNGNTLDAAALVKWFSYQMAHNPLAKATMDDPTGFKALNDDTVEIKLAKPYPGMPYALASYSLDVYDAATVESVHGKYEQLAGKGVFTGPYMLMSAANGTDTYMANPYYYLGKPAYSGLTVRVISSDTAGQQALASGEADMQFYAGTAEKRTIASNPNLIYKTSPTAVTYSAFCLNPSKTPFTDVRVREAFGLAIDNATISRTIMDGIRPALKGVFQDGFPLNVPWKTYNPAKAEALLDAAGWTQNGSGPRTKDGKTLSVEITTYDSDLESIATAAVDMLRKVGFDAKVLPEPNWSPIPPLITGKGPANVTMQNLQNIGYEGDYYLALSKNYNPDDQYNLSVRDPQIWGLFEKLLATPNKAKADSLLKQALKLDGQRVYYVPVVANPTTAVVTKPFANYVVNGFGLGIDYKTGAASA